jgi:hypothetical protein
LLVGAQKTEVTLAITHHRKELRRGDTAFLVAIAVFAMFAVIGAFFVGHRQTSEVIGTTEDDGARVPLPAGPRKYQGSNNGVVAQ